jgi:hypothetical protein
MHNQSEHPNTIMQLDYFPWLKERPEEQAKKFPFKTGDEYPYYWIELQDLEDTYTSESEKALQVQYRGIAQMLRERGHARAALDVDLLLLKILESGYILDPHSLSPDSYQTGIETSLEFYLDLINPDVIDKYEYWGGNWFVTIRKLGNSDLSLLTSTNCYGKQFTVLVPLTTNSNDAFPSLSCQLNPLVEESISPYVEWDKLSDALKFSILRNMDNSSLALIIEHALSPTEERYLFVSQALSRIQLGLLSREYYLLCHFLMLTDDDFEKLVEMIPFIGDFNRSGIKRTYYDNRRSSNHLDYDSLPLGV